MSVNFQSSCLSECFTSSWRRWEQLWPCVWIVRTLDDETHHKLYCIFKPYHIKDNSIPNARLVNILFRPKSWSEMRAKFVDLPLFNLSSMVTSFWWTKNSFSTLGSKKRNIRTLGPTSRVLFLPPFFERSGGQPASPVSDRHIRKRGQKNPPCCPRYEIIII